MMRVSNHSKPDPHRNFDDSTNAAMQKRLIDVLRVGHINAIEARQRLEVTDPHLEVKNLRSLGHNIQATLIWVNAGDARRICVPEYALLPGKYQSKAYPSRSTL